MVKNPAAVALGKHRFEHTSPPHPGRRHAYQAYVSCSKKPIALIARARPFPWILRTALIEP
jgi:hypothetical protein